MMDYSKLGNMDLADLASLGYNYSLNKNKDALLKATSVSDINDLLSGYANYIGSGRQGSGRTSLDSLYFDQNGNVLVKSGKYKGATYSDDGPTARFENDTMIYDSPYFTGDTITSTANNDGGYSFYNPYEELEQGFGQIPNSGYKEDGYLKFADLSDDLKQNIIEKGLFPNINNVDAAKWADSQWSWAGLDPSALGSETLDQNQLRSILGAANKINKEGIRNVSQKESHGLSTYVPAIGQMALGSMLTAGLANSLGSYFGLSPTMAKVGASGITSALKGGNPLTSMLSGGVNSYLSPMIGNVASGALTSVAKSALGGGGNSRTGNSSTVAGAGAPVASSLTGGLRGNTGALSSLTGGDPMMSYAMREIYGDDPFA